MEEDSMGSYGNYLMKTEGTAPKFISQSAESWDELRV